MLTYLKGIFTGFVLALVLLLATELHLGKRVTFMVTDANCSIIGEPQLQAVNYDEPKHRGGHERPH